jgi:hypothetical protein
LKDIIQKKKIGKSKRNGTKRKAKPEAAYIETNTVQLT